MKNVLKRVVVLLLVLSVLAVAVPMTFADKFTGYNCITTKEQLNDVRKSLNAKFYLGADIVFTEADFAPGGAFYNDGKGWEPIGSSGSNGFKGVFDGNGYIIKGLKINASGKTTCFAGLFGYNLGTINDVKLENVDIKVSDGSYAYVGAVCGATSKKGITGCWASGNINVDGIKIQAVVGGIAGGMYSGYIEKCINFCKIDVSDSSSVTAGGIAGTTASGITNCGNAGSVNAVGRGDVYGGGIVGDAGKVSGSGSAVSINNVYNVGTVSVDSLCDIYVGGIVGDSVVNVSQVFNSGVVAGRANTFEFKGRVLGRNNGGTVSDAYYISESAEQSDGMKGITAEQAADKSTFKGFDFDSTWVIENGIPVIKSFVIEKEEGGGSGDTSSDSTSSDSTSSDNVSSDSTSSDSTSSDSTSSDSTSSDSTSSDSTSSDSTSSDSTSSDSPSSGNPGGGSIFDEEVSKPVDPPKVEDDQIADGGEGDKNGGVDTNPPVSSTPSQDQPDDGDSDSDSDSNQGTTSNPTDSTTSNSTGNTTSNSTGNTTSNSTGETTKDPFEGTVSNSTGNTTSNSTGDSTNNSTGNTTSNSTGDSTNNSTGNTTSNSTGDSTNNSTGDSNEGTASDPTENTTSGSEGETTDDPIEGTESNPLDGTTSNVTSDSVVSNPETEAPGSTDDPFADPDEDSLADVDKNKGDKNSEEFEWGIVVIIISAVILITAGVVLAVKKGWIAALVKK